MPSQSGKRLIFAKMNEQTKPKDYLGQMTYHLLKRYYRVDEVALYFAISVRTVYRLLDEGDLKATRIRGCLRVSAEEIRRFEEKLKLEDMDGN